MEVALKKIVIPELRTLGFRGSFPHFRRVRKQRIDLLSFQFYSSGGSFVVEVSSCGPEGTRWSGPEKAKANEVDGKRLRLGADPSGALDHWFQFGLRNYEQGHEKVGPQSHYDAVAQSVRGSICSEAEPYWQSGLDPFAWRNHLRRPPGS